MLESIKRKGFERGGERRAFSDDSIRLIRSTLSVIMSDAMQDGIITLNPCSGLNQGRRTRAGRSARKKRRKRVHPLNVREREIFLGAIQGCWLGPLFETMVRCGLRPGEAYALTPSDVDLKTQQIHVQRSVTESGELKSTKTDESRYVDIRPYPQIVALLQQYIPWMGEIAARQGWQDAPLFPTISGTILNAANVRRDLKELLNKTEGLPKDRTPYDLRHTFVTYSLQVERHEIGFVSKQLGHDKVTTTWDYYYHWLPENMMTNRDADKWHRTTSRATEGATTGSSGESRDESDSETPMPQGEKWSRREDLNFRPADYESAALPLSYAGLL